MAPPRRGLLSQNFLWNRRLVDQLVRASSISPRDLVLEIGPGRGILTQALLQVAASVVAVELDEKLCLLLCEKLSRYTNLALVQGDWLTMRLPQAPYKVFSSIPYHHTGDIIRKLLQADVPPADCYLVVQSEAAAKYCVHDRRNSLAALLYYPWWDIGIVHHFQRADFVPTPGVDSVLLQIMRRETPLVDPRQKAAYQDYVVYRLGRDKRSKDETPGRFLSGFRSFIEGSSHHQLEVIQGSFARLQEQQRHLRKIHRTRTDPHWKKY